MKRFIFSFLLLFTTSNIVLSQTAIDSTQNTPKYSKTNNKDIQKQKEESSFKMNRVFFGGSLGFSFGSVTSVRVNPLIGYSITPKLSAGITGLYEYNSYDTYYGRKNYTNYGGSIFSRFRVIPQLYAHAEFSYINYEFTGLNNVSYRQSVPFLFLGGGYAQRIGGNTYAYAQILFDVLQDSNSPYENWAPFYSVGISVGF